VANRLDGPLDVFAGVLGRFASDPLVAR